MRPAFIPIACLLPALLALEANAQLLHFRITGDYEAPTAIAHRESGAQATVKDRVVFEFDQDAKTGKMGPIRFRNFPSSATALRSVEPSCPPPVMAGAYEHLEVTGVTYDGYAAFQLKGTRAYPEVQWTANCRGSPEKKKVAATTEPFTLGVSTLDARKPTVFSVKLENGWRWRYVVTAAGQ